YATWRHTTAHAARVPLGAVAAHPEADAGEVEAEAIASHRPAYGDIAGAPDPSDPGRLLLGPLHRHAAAGFHLDAVYTALFVRPVRAGAGLVRFLDREVVDTYVRGAGTLPRWLGTAVRRAQTGNVQTYVSALLAGAVVLAVAAVLVAMGACAGVIDLSESVMQFLLAFLVVGPLLGAAAALLPAPPGLKGKSPDQAVLRHGVTVTGAVLLAAIALAAGFDHDQPSKMQATTDISWIPALDVRIHLGTDGISLPLLVLTALLTFLSALYSYFKPPAGPS